MKKKLIAFATQMLSKEQMKLIKGGNNCSTSCPGGGSISVSCPGDCSAGNGYAECNDRDDHGVPLGTSTAYGYQYGAGTIVC